MGDDRQAQPMRVYFVATMYPSDASDFRGVFIRYMAYALAALPGVELVAWTPPGALPTGTVVATTPAEAEWLRRLLQGGGISHLMRSGGIRALLAPLKLLHMLAAGYGRHRNVDLYHINWLQAALPLPANGKPVLVTVLGNDLRLLRLPFMRSLLRWRVMRARKVAICPNAEWMEAPLRSAFGDVAEIIPVSFGIDPAWYAIQRARDDQRRIWLVVSRLTADKLGPLFEWSQPLFDGTGRELHLFGPMEQDIEVPGWVHYHGPASPESLARDWFPVAQGLITLSRHAEGRPQVMLEAMASGLPIIASRMPAHATVVVDRETGLLCDSSDNYGAAIEALEHADSNRRYGTAARERALAEMGTWDDCAARYRRIHVRLMEDASLA